MFHSANLFSEYTRRAALLGITPTMSKEDVAERFLTNFRFHTPYTKETMAAFWEGVFDTH